MADINQIELLNGLIGLKIEQIKYVPTKFHYNLSGDWSDVSPETFLLHSPTWIWQFTNGTEYSIINDNGSVSFSTQEVKEDCLNVPKKYQWTEFIHKEIEGFRIWKQVKQSRALFGLLKKTEDLVNNQIIEFKIGNRNFCFTVMDGDIGDMTFYPRGTLGERIGVFFHKLIPETFVFSGMKTEMEIEYNSFKK
ncbi:MAG: hypothetical protein ACWA41_06175 [Putridiphycobacter sp.]